MLGCGRTARLEFRSSRDTNKISRVEVKAPAPKLWMSTG